MNTIDVSTAYDKVCEYVKQFTQNIENGQAIKIQRALIQNVDFVDLIDLFGLMQGLNCQLYLPGEVGTESLCIFYKPTPFTTITIESEPALNYLWKVKHQNINLN